MGVELASDYLMATASDDGIAWIHHDSTAGDYALAGRAYRLLPL